MLRRILLALCVVAIPVATAACTPDDVAEFQRWYHPAPAPSAAHNCYGTDAQPYIDDAFAGTGQEGEFSHIAWGESRCTPGDNMFQLIGKWGYIESACPGYPGGATVAIHDPYCNAHAARLMFNDHGTNDWRATR